MRVGEANAGGPGAISVPGATECGCLACQKRRRATTEGRSFFQMDPHFRYACEVCGNKRCSHHTDHTLACTGSNEPGQDGSAWA